VAGISERVRASQLPVGLVLVLRQIGYDARGYWLQSAIAVAGVAAGRLFGPVANIDYAYVEPLLGRTWGGPMRHVATVAAFLVLVVYPLSHLLVLRLVGGDRATVGLAAAGVSTPEG
jgi:hypothetical protein